MFVALPRRRLWRKECQTIMACSTDWPLGNGTVFLGFAALCGRHELALWGQPNEIRVFHGGFPTILAWHEALRHCYALLLEILLPRTLIYEVHAPYGSECPVVRQASLPNVRGWKVVVSF